MSEPEETQYFAVVVPVGEECYSKGHNLNPYEDGICCADCKTIAVQAVVDGIDPDTAIGAFRGWEPELGLSRPVGSLDPRSNLQDASRPDRKDQDRAQHEGEQEGDRKRYILVRTIEVDLDPLEVQKDEDQE